MVTASPSLDQVAQRIAEQEAALKALRREYEARKEKLDTLTRRKRELQAQLQQVESQMQDLAGKIESHAATKPAPPPAAKPASAPATRPAAAPPAKHAAPAAGESVSLPRLLAQILRDKGHPLSNRELTDEVRRRKFPSQSSDLLKQVTTRVSELVRKGILRRTRDAKGVLLPGSANGKKPTPAPASKTPLLKTRPQGPAPKPAQEPQSLQAVLTRVLQKADKPLGGAEVARRAQQAGYQSKSKDFTNLVWVTLGKMENVQNIRGQGYRLKKR